VRDVLLLLIVGTLVPLALFRPWIGALAWVWISIQSPHRMTYGFMFDAPVAQVMALATIFGLVLTREHRRIPVAPPIMLMIVFTAWMCVTFPFSLVPTVENRVQLEKVLKIMLMNLVVLTPLHTRRHVDMLIAAMALSIAFFGVKGGIFAILTGGNFQVRGGGGFIEPNNELALALVMTIPLLVYLRTRVAGRLVKLGFAAAIFLSVVAAIASQSRGALVAILGMALVFVLRAQGQRFKLTLTALALGVFIAAFMPEQWWSRMETIQTYESDASATGRINAWILAFRVASDHFFGGGFVLEEPMIFDRYAPNPGFIAVAHSVYFQVLGHHGFVGLAIYLLTWFTTFRTAGWIYRNSPDPADKQLARAVEASLVAFFVGGAFLSLAYFDGPYYLMIALVIMRYKVLGNRVPGRAPPAAATSSVGAVSS
jgi:putative inorganic carbon (HCO3(-)) transporter